MTRSRRHWMITLVLAGSSATAFAAARLPSSNHHPIAAIATLGACAPMVEFVAEELGSRLPWHPQTLRIHRCQDVLD